MVKTSASISATRRPTMTDVAKAAGVSQSTVSMVLNNVTGARLADQTRARVFSVAMELGYRLTRRETSVATAHDHSVQSTQRNLIAYLVDEISTSPHPVQSIDGARDAAWVRGCVLQVAVTKGNVQQESALIESFKNNPSLLGVVYSTIFTRAVEVPSALRELPTVLLNCHDSSFNAPTILPSELAGGHGVTEYLLGKGHTRIGFINGEAWMEAAKDRLKGYRRALATHDIAFDANLVQQGDWNASSGYRGTLALMQMDRPPTAIFCANDLMAIGALQALNNLGKRVPSDVAVMGYDDQEIAQHTTPALSSALLPNYDMGKSALEALLDLPSQSLSKPKLIKIECPVVIRDSA